MSWLMILTLVFQLHFTSCQDEDSAGGAPVIEGVRVPNPEQADSLFVKASPGSIIAIIGRNLQNAQHVYINDQDVYFNSTMNTNHSIMLTIPTEENGFVLTPWDKDLKAEIRVETPGGVATYAFQVLSPSPSAQRIAGSYPRETGNELVLYGRNLVDITRVYITDLTPEEIAESESETIGGNQVDVSGYILTQNHYLDNKSKTYVTESVLTFDLPNLSFDSGSMVVECAAGNAIVIYAKRPPRPVVTKLSTDMPIPGATVIVTGSNFIQVESVKYGNEVISDLYVSATEDTVTFTMGAKPTAHTSALTVVTPGGESVGLPFYEYERLLLDFDTSELGVNLTWSPDAAYKVADGSTAPFVSDGTFALIEAQDNGYNYWGTMIYWQKSWDNLAFVLPGYDLIPANTPANEVYIAMEVYNANPFLSDGTSFMRYELQALGNDALITYDNERVYGTDGSTLGLKDLVLPDIDDNQPLNQWYRAVLPISKFNKFATYQDLVNANINRIRLQDINQGGVHQTWYVCVDNVRLITK
ncbi:MAG: hypothetical protein LBO74_11215 [Candidatus Symbiothrix sp.]|nr:hypothetical protein [Candidatus Symbiothrix sp.]